MAAEYKQLGGTYDVSVLTATEIFNINFGAKGLNVQGIYIQVIMVGVDSNVTIRLQGSIKDNADDAISISALTTSGTLSSKISSTSFGYPFANIEFTKSSATVGTFEIWYAYV